VPLALVALLVDFSFIRDPLNTRLADAIVRRCSSDRGC
jgi:hypothetical protein